VRPDWVRAKLVVMQHLLDRRPESILNVIRAQKKDETCPVWQGQERNNIAEETAKKNNAIWQGKFQRAGRL
jgi:hypothetical protein